MRTRDSCDCLEMDGGIDWCASNYSWNCDDWSLCRAGDLGLRRLLRRCETVRNRTGLKWKHLDLLQHTEVVLGESWASARCMRFEKVSRGRPKTDCLAISLFLAKHRGSILSVFLES